MGFCRDKNLKSLPADICGKIYRVFNPFEIEATLVPQIKEWLENDLKINTKYTSIQSAVERIRNDFSKKGHNLRKIIWLLMISRTDGYSRQEIKDACRCTSEQLNPLLISLTDKKNNK